MKNKITNYDPNELLIWIDLETTGFDTDFEGRGCHIHKILEIGLHITDSNLNIIDEGIQIPIYHDYNDIKDLMDNVVVNMHTKSGLLEDIKKSNFSLEQAEKEVLIYLSQYNIPRKKIPICGNNVGFDKGFIDAQMFKLSDLLHYRKLDVSSFKELFSRLFKNDYKAPEKGMNHRALPDIKESIKELRSYVKKYMIPVANFIEDIEEKPISEIKPKKNTMK